MMVPGSEVHADPCVALRAKRRVATLFAAGGVGVALVWALWPVSISERLVESDEAAAPPAMARSAALPLETAPFSARIWVEPEVVVVEAPRPAPPPPPLPNAPPIKLQLLGIERLWPVAKDDGSSSEEAGSERWRAVLYDPESDRIIMVSDGERVGLYDVASVGATTLVLRVATPQFAPREDVLNIHSLGDEAASDVRLSPARMRAGGGSAGRSGGVP